MLPLIKRKENRLGSGISSTNAAIVSSSCSLRQILSIIFVVFLAVCGITATTNLSPEGGTTVGTILSAALSAAGGTVDPKYTPAIGSASHSPSYDFTTKKPKSGPTASSATTQQVATTDNPGEHPAINPTPFPTKYPTKVPTLPPKASLPQKVL